MLEQSTFQIESEEAYWTLTYRVVYDLITFHGPTRVRQSLADSGTNRAQLLNELTDTLVEWWVDIDIFQTAANATACMSYTNHEDAFFEFVEHEGKHVMDVREDLSAMSVLEIVSKYAFLADLNDSLDFALRGDQELFDRRFDYLGMFNADNARFTAWVREHVLNR